MSSAKFSPSPARNLLPPPAHHHEQPPADISRCGLTPGKGDPAIQAAGVPGPAKPDKNNWAPRFGFAYSPGGSALFGNGKTAVRGGFGMGYDVLFYNILTVNASNYPRVVNSITNSPDTFNLFPTLAPKIANIPPFNPTTTAFVNSPVDTQNPTTNYWSLSVQRELGTNYVVEIGYSGNRSYHQIRQGQANYAESAGSNPRPGSSGDRSAEFESPGFPDDPTAPAEPELERANHD